MSIQWEYIVSVITEKTGELQEKNRERRRESTLAHSQSWDKLGYAQFEMGRVESFYPALLCNVALFIN